MYTGMVRDVSLSGQRQGGEAGLSEYGSIWAERGGQFTVTWMCTGSVGRPVYQDLEVLRYWSDKHDIQIIPVIDYRVCLEQQTNNSKHRGVNGTLQRHNS